MTAIVRWWRFNLVGALGMAVQVASLAVLIRWIPRHYLWASALALEITLLHNFAWHLRFTWSDRRTPVSTLGRLLRFHLSNGLISLAGNLILMRVLVQNAQLPVLAANVVAVLCCAALNFCAGDQWVFPPDRHLLSENKLT